MSCSLLSSRTRMPCAKNTIPWRMWVYFSPGHDTATFSHTPVLSGYEWVGQRRLNKMMIKLNKRSVLWLVTMGRHGAPGRTVVRHGSDVDDVSRKQIGHLNSCSRRGQRWWSNKVRSPIGRMGHWASQGQACVEDQQDKAFQGQVVFPSPNVLWCGIYQI